MNRLVHVGLLALLVFALAVLGAVPTQAADKGRPDAPAVGKLVPDTYIVTLKDGVNVDKLLADGGIKAKHVYSAVLNGFTAELKPQQLAALQKNPNIALIEQDQEVTIETTQTNPPWGLDRIDQRALPLSGTYTYNTTASNVNAYIIDTGIQTGHPEFEGRATNPYTYPGGSAGDCNGHGTHVAGTVGAALNGLGMTGVAPNITLVNVRGGQDSGYVFMQPVVDALVYSGDIGIDVVNMSFYIDPWLFNCPDNPADSPEQQMEQRTVLASVQRALDYARKRGVTLVSSAGNNHFDLGNPPVDTSSPDYPAGISHPRVIDNATCRSLPTEGEGVISVSSIGPSKAKADYSNYGVEQIIVAAPGGYFRDFFGTPQYRQNNNQILSTYPKNVLEAGGLLFPDGTPRTATVIRDCQNGVCGYYAYLQGTSMAAPHVTGVVALIISEYGNKDGQHKGGLTMNPVQTEKILVRSATETACPEPRLVDYTVVGRTPDFNAYCEGTAEFNGFYGYGIVSAIDAVTGPRGRDD
jgi:subtilisin family serine protease